jgi:ureidoacrylate peracid hydrolase
MTMNWFAVPEGITQRVIARTGAVHPHSDLDPKRTALVVIDLQNAFMDEQVGHAVCPTACAIVPNVNRLASVVRSVGGGVFWIKNTFDDRAVHEWSNAHAMLTPENQRRRIEAMREGSKGQELWPELDVRPDDEIVRKYRFSAFLPGTCELPYRLRARGFDTVLITGTVTNVCCESSARDAMMTNFKTIMISDANAAMTMEEHNASLIAFYAIFGDVMDTEFVIRRLTRNA